MTAPFKDHFSTGSANYAAHRPTYPARLVDELAALSRARSVATSSACRLSNGCMHAPLAGGSGQEYQRALRASLQQIGMRHGRLGQRVAPPDPGLDDTVCMGAQHSLRA